MRGRRLDPHSIGDTNSLYRIQKQDKQDFKREELDFESDLYKERAQARERLKDEFGSKSNK